MSLMISDMLEGVSKKAIRKCDEILDMELPDPDDESFGPILRAQTSVTNTVLTTQTKVDENALRKREQDIMPEIIAKIQRYRVDNPTRIVPDLTVIEGGKK